MATLRRTEAKAFFGGCTLASAADRSQHAYDMHQASILDASMRFARVWLTPDDAAAMCMLQPMSGHSCTG